MHQRGFTANALPPHPLAASHLAESIAELPGIRLDPREVETNIVIFEVDERLGTNQEFAERMHQRGVWMFTVGSTRIRAVTHLDLTRTQIDQAVDVFREFCAAAQVA